MNTKNLMIASVMFWGIMGIGLTFLPEEIYKYLSTDINQTSVLTLQILGSTYLGFAVLNWMSKNNVIGGIYSKPLVVGNLVHFLVSFFALIKIIGSIKNHFEIILALTIIYSVFTLCFGYVSMANPSKLKSGGIKTLNNIEYKK